MRQFTAFTLILGALNAVVGDPFPFVLELDLSPEQAAEYLKDPPGAIPNLAPKTATLPLVRSDDPQFRSAQSGPTHGHYWRNGHEIENTQDFVEDVYDASQFHGQDGLGAFAYGYSAPESFKAEQRERNGDVRGYYAYRNPADLRQLVKVNYWADKEGFHQEDNLPKAPELQPVQETEEVRQARLAHEKAWQEAAAAAAVNPDPNGEYNPKAYEYDGQASGRDSVGVKPAVPAGPNQPEPREPKALKHPKNEEQEEDEEPKGPPRGFFYSFHYPVSVIVAKSSLDAHGKPLTGSPVDDDTVGLDTRSAAGPHDAQVPKRP